MKLKVQKFRQYIGNLCQEVRHIFLLQEYDMEIVYEKQDSYSQGYQNCFQISTDPRYLRFVITVFPIIQSLFKKKNYIRIAHLICHEFSHVLIEPVSQLAEQYENKLTREFYTDTIERQTQRISNVIFQLLSKDVYMAKAKLGSGARFKAAAESARKGGAKNPQAVAAMVGMKKYGVAKMEKMAAAGRKHAK